MPTRSKNKAVHYRQLNQQGEDSKCLQLRNHFFRSFPSSVGFETLTVAADASLDGGKQEDASKTQREQHQIRRVTHPESGRTPEKKTFQEKPLFVFIPQRIGWDAVSARKVETTRQMMRALPL